MVGGPPGFVLFSSSVACDVFKGQVPHSRVESGEVVLSCVRCCSGVLCVALCSVLCCVVLCYVVLCRVVVFCRLGLGSIFGRVGGVLGGERGI